MCAVVVVVQQDIVSLVFEVKLMMLPIVVVVVV
jgi:hypothetical protein